MTRAEAIEILKDDVMCQRGWINQLSGMTKEIAEGRIKAHELAISSLETDEAYQLEYENPTTKNDLGVDCISRADVDAVIEQIRVKLKDGRMYILAEVVQDIIRELPAVTPQEPQSFEWCETCKEYDQEKHCCHRWSKIIRNTVEEMKQEQKPKTGHWIEHPHEAGPCWEYSRYECSECHDWAEDDSDYCPYCGAKMEVEDNG